MGEDKDQIVEGIYLGNITATNDLEALKKENITYILGIDAQPLNHITDGGGITYKFVQKLDMPEYDLLSHFDECFTFIDEALSVKGRGVLVHCMAGMSRSATIVIGYLMSRHKMPLQEALGTVKEKRPRIRPNPGFMEQLELFDKMEGSLDVTSELYRRYRLNVLTHRIQSGSLDEVKETELCDLDPASTEDFYRCWKCRRALFRKTTIMSHPVGRGEAAFDWRSRVPASQRPADITLDQSGEVCDKSLFIEPVKWMAEFINKIEGKINCPKCQTKLGSFTWYGEKCPCGAWVAPAFHIQSSKVDRVKAVSKLPAKISVPPALTPNKGQTTVDTSNPGEMTLEGDNLPKQMESLTVSR